MAMLLCERKLPAHHRLVHEESNMANRHDMSEAGRLCRSCVERRREPEATEKRAQTYRSVHQMDGMMQLGARRALRRAAS